MKRFIDLRGQIYDDNDLPLDEQEICFAFFCTVTDSFDEYNGAQMWESIEDFKNDFNYLHSGSQDKLNRLLNRLLNLMPNWVPEA